MKSSIEKLYKVFKLEAERGFDDGAVVGGMGKILNSWESEARLETISESVIEVVTTRIRDYKRLSPDSRRVTLIGLWKRIRKESDQTLPDIISVPKPEQKESPPPAVDDIQSVKIEDKKTIEVHIKSSESAPIVEKVPEIETAPHPDENAAALDSPLTVLSGVGPRYAKSLEKLGIFTLRDALHYYPRRYDDYSNFKTINRLWYGEEVTIIGTVTQISSRNLQNRKRQIVEAIVNDGSGSIRVTWFNQPWLVKKLRGAHIVLSGKVEQYLGRLVMSSPEWELLEKKNLNTNRIVPVYPLTAQITQRWLRRTLHQVISYWAPKVRDPLPETIRKNANLMPLAIAVQQVHYPDSQSSLNQARHRLAFDEIVFLQLGVLRQRQHWKSRTAKSFTSHDNWLKEQIEALPFLLTNAQQKALNDIQVDLGSGSPMNRLLQGDVGSGKTVVAVMAVKIIAKNGSQSALMAPTSILAEQHYQSMIGFLSKENSDIQPHQIRLLVGATTEAEKQEIRTGLDNGDIKLVVGTHAIIESNVHFSDLQLIIIDEQHRFGVQQRGSLRGKGNNPHLLVMTATPIPRSLALSVYGDLDLTIIDEMPPGRQEVSTHILLPVERERGYSLIRREIKKGYQAFMIFPLVEESEKSDTKAAVEEHAFLQKEVFSEKKLALLHGRLKPNEKETTMAAFRNGDYDILVSTSVVEVGVDVPNATVMLIEGANRFGLAQLHQFRGRVGRGTEKSYCILIPESDDDAENERLGAMAETNDGFVLAERDLEQRGPGEFIGTRQSGFTELKMASLSDVKLIEKARRFAQEIFGADPELKNSEHSLLKDAVEQFWTAGASDIS